ncbi:substrate-binding domain-containing protein [Janibacter limosus]|uniref:substrate-binding domain-containing protein n=1 Tax=Janibacter limosus TaxID=53458 RepID=UPI00215235DD|nr:substrate-binding domain-containing protein [Janibacter limosus]WKV16184.1 substrate-binding domain-containing protein [Janibacter limosus]
MWPIKGGEAAKGTSGVVDTIGAGEGNIGYADASQIGDLKAAKIKAGKEFIEYSPEAAAKILESAKRVDETSKSNYAVKLDRGNAGEGVYPVVLVSYAVACSEYKDPETANTVKSYLEYAISAEGRGGLQGRRRFRPAERGRHQERVRRSGSDQDRLTSLTRGPN